VKPAWILLPLLLALALALRVRGADELSVSPEEQVSGGVSTVWQFDDARSALTLRRVQLALAADRLPATDRMIAYPDLREYPGLPVFPGLVAIASELTLSRKGGDPALGGVDEARFETFIAYIPVVLGVLTTLLVFLAAGAMSHVRSKFAAAMLAASVFAVAPVAVHSGSVAQIETTVWIALLLALADRAYHARDSLDRVQAALLTGVLVGTALASSPLGLVLFVAAWCGYLAAATHTDELRAHTAQREGLLFCLIAGAVSLVANLEGPWQVEAGSLSAHAARGTTGVVVASCVPFLLGAIPLFKRSSRGLRVAVSVLVVTGLVIVLPGVAGGLWDAVRVQLFDRDLIVTEDGRGPLLWGAEGLELTSFLRELTPLVLLFPFAWLLAAGRWPRPERVLLLVLGLALGVLALFERSFAPLVMVPMAVTLGVVADDESRRAEARVRRRFVPIMALLVLGAHAVAPFLSTPDVDTRAERIHFLRGLRWMRDNTPSPGAWNAPTPAKDWGVLSVPAVGPAIAYHARRPAIASGTGAFLGSARDGAVSNALLAEGGEDFLRRARSLGAAYIVVAPRMLRDARRLETVAAELSGSGKASGPARLRRSVLWALTFPATDGQSPYPELERVYASDLRVTPEGRAPVGGEPSGPAVSIYKLPLGPPERIEAEMRAR
jgi:hypothetical protein